MNHNLLDLGRQVAADPTCRDLTIGDPPRPMTNTEMHAFVCWSHRETREKIARDGCCGGPMGDSGYCPRTGHGCEVWEKAKMIERKLFEKKETA
jgi:hypothetical protein